MLAVVDQLGERLSGEPQTGLDPRCSQIVYRELSIDEWNLLKTVPPFDTKATPAPESARVIVAQDNESGELVAYWFVFTAIHVEPAWIAPSHRHRPTVVRKLWNAVRGLLNSLDCNLAFCSVNYDAPYMNASMAQRLGFKRLPTDLYFLNTKNGVREL